MLITPHVRQTTLRQIFLFSIFIIPFIFIPHFRFFADLPKNCWLQASAALLVLAWFSSFLVTSPQKITLRTATFLGPLVIFLLWTLVSLAYATNPYEVMQRWMTWASAFLFLLLTVDLFDSEDRIIQLFAVISLSAAGIALIGIFQHLNGFDLIPQAARPASTFGNKNMAIHFIILTLPLSIGLFFTSKKEWLKLALPSLFSLQAAYLIFSRTRAGWLAFFIELIFIVFMLIRASKQNPFRWAVVKSRGIIYAIFLFFCLMGIEQISPYVDGQTFSSKIQHTMSQMGSPGKQVRVAYWLNSLAMIKDHPMLGVGLANFITHYPLYHRAIRKDPSFDVHVHVATPHNDYLQLIVETGLIGFACAFWALFRVGHCLIPTFKNSESSTKKTLLIVLTSALLGIGVVAFFSFPFQRTTPPLLTFVYIGLLANLTANIKSLELSKNTLIIGGVITIFSSVYIVSIQWHKIRSEFHLTQAISFYLAESYSASTKQAFKAYRLEPQRKENLYYLGLASLYNNHLAQAIYFLEQDLQYEPNNITALSALGLAYGKAGEFDKGMERFEKSLEIFPEHWLTYANMGSVYQSEGDLNKAKNSYKRALSYHNSRQFRAKLEILDTEKAEDMNQEQEDFSGK